MGNIPQAAPSVAVFTVDDGSTTTVTNTTVVTISFPAMGPDARLRWERRLGGGVLYYYIVWGDSSYDPTDDTYKFRLYGITEGSSQACNPQTKCTQTFLRAYDVSVLGIPQMMSLVSAFAVPGTAMLPPISGVLPKGSLELSTTRALANVAELSQFTAAFNMVFWYVDDVL